MIQVSAQPVRAREMKGLARPAAPPRPARTFRDLNCRNPYDQPDGVDLDGPSWDWKKIFRPALGAEMPEHQNQWAYSATMPEQITPNPQPIVTANDIPRTKHTEECQ
jgi:hypothetical protein